MCLLFFGFFLFCFVFAFCLFRAAPTAYGGPQARGLIGAIATGLHHSARQRQIQAASVTYTTAQGYTGSLTQPHGP